MPIRVRFAPSPTGPFSLGNARTALFAWLFAQHEKGEFLLRIEDTDKERSQKQYEDQILEGLKWLGIQEDEPLIRQSERTEIYEKYLAKLLDERKAYYCFCTPEELEEERQAQMSQGISPRYSGKCFHIKSEDTEEKLKTHSAVIRFRMPERRVSFHDIIRGKVEFNTALIGDIVIAKNIMEPLYHFTVVVDDEETAITHVIRGEDHLANTPKHIMLQEALGFKTPMYAHLPLILTSDRKKLSKRFLTTSFNDYKLAGYLPQAMINFLALLGWHPEKDREALTVEELIKEFSLERVQKGGAVFNEEKLDWLNAQHLRMMSAEEIADAAKSFLPPHWFDNPPLLYKAIQVEKDRVIKLSDFSHSLEFFFELPSYSGSLLAWKETPFPKVLEHLKAVRSLVEAIPEEDILPRAWYEEKIMEYANIHGRGEVLWPLRVSLSGKEASPGPFEIMEVLGKQETLARIDIAIGKLSLN